METRVGSPPSVTISVSASEEMRASRRNSSVSNSPNSQGAGQFFGGSFEDPSSSFAASSNNGVGNHSLKSFNLRRSSSLADEEMTKMKNLTLKLIHVLTERAKLNPALKDPMRIPLVLESESGDITNILKAESQFAPMVNFNSEYTMLDAINEEVDCALMDAVDNYGHPTFLPEDEEVLYLFLREVSNKLHGTNGKSFSRRRGTKLASLIQMDAALLEAYTSLKTSIACAHITKVERNIHTYVPTLTPNFENDCAFHKWSFDPFVRTDTELMEVAFQMVSNFGLIEKFGIEKEKLRTLISIARKNYRPNAFHNFYHAMGVMHLSYQILRRGAAEYLTPLDILAVLLGALCHDLDHPGNNKFVN